MKYKNIVVIFITLLLFYATVVYSQDTLCYRQSNSLLFSNYYYFYKSNQQPLEGIFEKFMNYDDCQRWYGRGKFTEYKNKIILDSFKIVRTIHHFMLDSNFNDSSWKDSLIYDTTIVQPLIFHKKGDNLYLKGGRKKNKTKFDKVLKPIPNLPIILY